MQNEFFEFMFCDKSRVDERSFFLCFLPYLSRLEEKTCTSIREGIMATMREDKSLTRSKEGYSPSPDIFYVASYNHLNRQT